MSNLSPAFLSSLSGPWHSKQLFDNSGSICFEKFIFSGEPYTCPIIKKWIDKKKYTIEFVFMLVMKYFLDEAHLFLVVDTQ